MAKSKRNSNKSSKKKKTEEEPPPPSPAAPDDSGGGDADDGALEVWDIVRAYTTAEMDDVDARRTCMTDGCGKVAVAAWASDKAPGEVWESCEGCQANDFGGWPDGFVRPKGKEDGDGGGSDAGGEADGAEKPDGAEEAEGAEGEGDAGTPPEDQQSDAEEEEKQEQAMDVPLEDEGKERQVDDGEGKEEQCDDAEAKEEQDDQADEVAEEGNDKEEKEGDPAAEIATASSDDASNSDADAALSAGEEVKSTKDDEDEESSSEAGASKDSEEDEASSPESKPQSLEEDEASSPESKPQSLAGSSAEGSSGGEEEETWIIKRTFTVAELNFSSHNLKICDTESCTLPACSIWMSTKTDEIWNSCVDCQELDYGGWPPGEETPSMSEEHIAIMASKCSRQDSPVMPPPRQGKGTKQKRKMDDAVDDDDAPMPNASSKKRVIDDCDDDDDDASSPAKTTQTKLGQKSSSNTAAHVTPPPNGKRAWQKKKPPQGMAGVTPSPVPPTKQPSATALAMHRKWQEAAEAMGGKDARIVVSKPAAKKLIFDLLHEAFAPMNITSIYNELRAVVPSPVLKSAIDDMTFEIGSEGFENSDDEDDDTRKKKPSPKESSSSDPYAASLIVKVGRNTNNTLYFVNQSKLKNDGNGLILDERHKLLADLEQATAEEAELIDRLKQTTDEGSKLLSEPTNAEAESKLQAEEEFMNELNEKLDHFRKLSVNEKTRKQTKKRAEKLTAQWRSRKRICMDFLIMIEDSTEGAVSMAKCLKGDGQIEVDSDEAVVKGAVEWAKKKRARAKNATLPKAAAKRSKLSSSSLVKGGNTGTENAGAGGGLPPTETFVAINLDASGRVRRVHLDVGSDE